MSVYHHINLYKHFGTLCWRDMPPTVDGELDGRAPHAADEVLHRAHVHVIVRHHHARHGQHLLVVGKLQTRVIGQHLAALQPTVDGLRAVVVGTVEVKVLAVLQDGGGDHLDVRSGHGH